MTDDTAAAPLQNVYKMRISRLAIDKLGVKLYDKVSAVIAELVANSYDADATRVDVWAPMDVFLATKTGGKIQDKGYKIVVKDDGHGMDPGEVNDFFLVVGAERRKDSRRGSRSRKFQRKVMGRKGVGKLAPFGICRRIEILSAGGPSVRGVDSSGARAKGHRTAHLILKSDDMIVATDEEYFPERGELDGTISATTGTTITLSCFEQRKVPALDDLHRQMAQRFGIQSANWQIWLHDAQKGEVAVDRDVLVGELEVNANPMTRFTFEGRVDGTSLVRNSEGALVPDLVAGIEVEGRFYPLNGWVAYSAKPFRDDTMAGVRIYCNGKIAAQTTVFNRKAGFTGEHDIRSYLVGVLHADWLDEDEDLIQTDRRDILWSSELGTAFQSWGQKLVTHMGAKTRRAVREDAWEAFQAATDIDARIRAAFPRDDQEEIRERAVNLAKLLGERMRRGSAEEDGDMLEVADLVLNFSPHLALSDELKRAADAHTSALAAVSAILGKARIAELSSFGKIADQRVKVIGRVEQLKDQQGSDESALQKLITNAPWLIDPQWSPVIENRSFKTLAVALERFFRERGIDAHLTPVDDHAKRMDFAMANHEGWLEIVEIKKTGHAFDMADYSRFWQYVDLLEEFWTLPGNEVVVAAFPKSYRFTIVADGMRLNSKAEASLNWLRSKDKLTAITWESFLAKAKQAHQDFLEEAERQMREGRVE